MKRTVLAISLAALVVIPGGALATASPARDSTRSHRFIDHLTGTVLETHGKRSVEVSTVSTNDSGPGAAVTVTRSVAATSGVFTSVTYLSDGSVRAAGLYEVKTPAGGAPGVLEVSLSGHITGGTGADKGAVGQFRGTGTDNTTTKMQIWTVTGTITP